MAEGFFVVFCISVALMFFGLFMHARQGRAEDE